jgi:hypothetical protein
MYVCLNSHCPEYTASHPGDHRMQAQNVSINHTLQIKMNISEKITKISMLVFLYLKLRFLQMLFSV